MLLLSLSSGQHSFCTHLGRGHDGEGVHDPIGELLADFGDEECAHARPSTSAQGVCQLEALEAVTILRLLPHHVQYRIH